MPSPMRGRWHGEAVTDEVEAPRFATLATSSVCSASLRSQLPLIGKPLSAAAGFNPSVAFGASSLYTREPFGVRAKKAFPS